MKPLGESTHLFDLAVTAINSLFGYDFFISYAWADGRSYALSLRDRLSTGGNRFRCFLDAKEMGGGEAWRDSVNRALRRSAVLVVIGSEAALTRDAVYDEVRAFAVTGRPIVPIDFGGSIATLPRDHRLYDWLESRLRTAESGGLPSLDEGHVSNEVVQFLERSFTFIRVNRIRTTALACVIVVLTGLLAFAVNRFLAERAARQLAQARERDAVISAVRFATLSGDFESAARVLRDTPTTDVRTDWANWIVAQHRAPGTLLVEPIVGGEQIEGLHSLAFNAQSSTVAGLTRRRQTENDSRETLLVELDDKAGKVTASLTLPWDAEQIAASSKAGDFYVAAGGRVEGYTIADGEWRKTALQVDQRYSEIVLFDNAGAGLGIRNGALWELQLDTPAPVETLLARLQPGQALTRTIDGRAAGVIAAQKLEDPPGNDLRAGGLAMTAWTEDGRVRISPVAATPFPARLLSRSRLAWLDATDRLVLRGIAADDATVHTRPLFFKPWLGAAIEANDMLIVQEVADESLEIRTRFAVLDRSTGRDLLAGFLGREPVWSMAHDSIGNRTMLGGQGSWLLVASLANERVRSIPSPRPLEGPLAITGRRQLDARRAVDAIERRRVTFDLERASATDAAAAYPAVAHTLPNGGFLRYHSCPCLSEVSPDGLHVAFSGDSLVIARLTAAETAASLAGTLDLGALCQRILGDETRISWRADVDPPQDLRWVSSRNILLHGFHGHILVANIDSHTVNKLSPTEAVTALSHQGPVLASTMSGAVYEIDDADLKTFRRLANLRALYPIDAGARAFVAWMENPERTAWLVDMGGALQEVAALQGTTPPLDARMTSEGLVVLYAGSIRVYRRRLP